MIAAVAAGMCSALVALGLYRASRQVPKFYRHALTVLPASQKAAGQQFERNALALHNQQHRSGRWSVRFSAEEINGWLASELPAKFPRALPEWLSQPRIAIEPHRAQLGLRYAQGHIETILSLKVEVYLTREANELAIRILGVRAGSLPMPLAQLQAEVAERAAGAAIPLRWSEIDGDPVALVKLTTGINAELHRVVLEAVELGTGELTITGRTEDPQHAEPAVPVAAQPAASETRQR